MVSMFKFVIVVATEITKSKSQIKSQLW